MDQLDSDVRSSRRIRGHRGFSPVQ